jgi:DNA invertase Pin-like site-specific DNA recombinase
MTVLGYARVSTAGQELDIQLAELKAAGCEKILFEKESGVKEDRAALARLLKLLRRGDVVVVPALDRLTRGGPFKMLLALDQITSRGATYRSLAEPWIEQTHELEEIFAAFHGWVARKTREDIIRRTSAGRERARLKGVRFGRKPKLSPEQRESVLARKFAGERQKLIANDFGVSRSTISRLKPATSKPHTS